MVGMRREGVRRRRSSARVYRRRFRAWDCIKWRVALGLSGLMINSVSPQQVVSSHTEGRSVRSCMPSFCLTHLPCGHLCR